MARSTGGDAPLTLVHERPVVSLDGGVRALFDTGARAVLLSDSLASALELAVIETVEERGEVFTVLEPPSFSVDGYELELDGLPAYGFADTRSIGLAASGLDLLLPASLLSRHAVVLDPVAGSCWFGPVGSLSRSASRFGVRVGASVTAEGLVGVPVDVLGESSWFLLDTGVSCSLAASSVVSSWATVMGGELPTSSASVGPGNMAGLRVEARTPMVRVPSLTLGGEFEVPGVAFVVRADGDLGAFEGSLGGNVLRSFRVGLDLGAPGGGDVFVEQRAPVSLDGVGDTDQVGVTLVLADAPDGVVDDDGGGGLAWTIGATVTGLRDAGVEVGDELVAVDGTPVAGLPIGDVVGLLRGEVGTSRRLVLRRAGGDLVEATAPVVRVL